MRKVNIGGEFLDDASVARIEAIAAKTIVLGGVEQPILSKEEVYNLCIRRGTLNNEERKIINNHIVVTIDALLEKLSPFRTPRASPNTPAATTRRWTGLAIRVA